MSPEDLKDSESTYALFGFTQRAALDIYHTPSLPQLETSLKLSKSSMVKLLQFADAFLL